MVIRKILLLQDWEGRNKGEVIKMGEPHASEIVKKGIAEFKQISEEEKLNEEFKEQKKSMSGIEVNNHYKLMLSDNLKYILLREKNTDGIHDISVTQFEITSKGFDTILRDKIARELFVLDIILERTIAIQFVTKAFNSLREGYNQLKAELDQEASKKYEKKEDSNKIEIDPEKLERSLLPELLLPQENLTLVTDSTNKLNKHFKNTDLFYRVADNSVIEIIEGKMKVVTPSRLISLIENVCTPGLNKWVDKGQGNGYWTFNKKTTSEQVCKIILASPDFYSKLKRIEKILSVPIPILKEDKILFPLRGYNQELKLYLVEDSPELTNPNMDIEEAKKILDNLFNEFCYKDNVKESKTKSILGLLTPYLRGLYNEWYSRTPIFIYFANREGAGKDYLAAIRTLVFEGKAIEESPISTGKRDGGSNDELRKKFLTALMDGKGFLHFANCKGYINNAVLEQFSTTTNFSDRILGKNTSASFGNDIELSLSANTGTTMTPDLGRRSILINLFLGMEDTNKRIFTRPDLHAEIIKDRGLILSALHSLVMNWFNKGMPKGTELFSSFPEWAKISGGVIEAAGYDNPLKNVKIEEAGLDQETSDMKILYEYMFDNGHGDKWITKQELRHIVETAEDLSNNVFGWLDLQERSGQIKFSLLLEKYNNREFGNVIMKKDKNEKVSRQKIMFTSIQLEVKEENV